MPRPEKVEAVEELREKLGRAQTAVVLNFQGLPAPEMTALRRFVRKQGAEVRVVKNTLARRAAQEAGVPSLSALLTGPTLVVIGGDDPSVTFRVARECARRYNQLQIRGGVFAGEAVTAEQVEWYANLPSREELLARLAGAVSGPIRGLVVALSGVIRKLALALAEVQKKKERGEQ